MGLAAFIAALSVLIGRALNDDSNIEIGMCRTEMANEDTDGVAR